MMCLLDVDGLRRHAQHPALVGNRDAHQSARVAARRSAGLPRKGLTQLQPDGDPRLDGEEGARPRARASTHGPAERLVDPEQARDPRAGARREEPIDAAPSGGVDEVTSQVVLDGELLEDDHGFVEGLCHHRRAVAGQRRAKLAPLEQRLDQLEIGGKQAGADRAQVMDRRAQSAEPQQRRHDDTAIEPQEAEPACAGEPRRHIEEASLKHRPCKGIIAQPSQERAVRCMRTVDRSKHVAPLFSRSVRAFSQQCRCPGADRPRLSTATLDRGRRCASSGPVICLHRSPPEMRMSDDHRLLETEARPRAESRRPFGTRA